MKKMIEKRTLGLTHVTQSFPWGLYLPTGHRLLCSDGITRAARLAQTADTFYSVPASVRVKGKSVSGYMTVENAEDLSSRDEGKVYIFCHHTAHDHVLPEWPNGWEQPSEREAIFAGAAARVG